MWNQAMCYEVINDTPNPSHIQKINSLTKLIYDLSEQRESLFLQI